MRREIRCIALLAFGLTSLMAQKGGTATGTGGGGSTTGGTTGTTGGRSPNIGTQQPTGQQSNQQQQQQPAMPVFLYGRVVMDDGTPPPTSISIKRLCSGTPRTMAYTSPKGQFNITWGGSQPGMFYDASEGPMGRGDGPDSLTSTGGFGGGQLGGASSVAASFLGCELFAELPGYRSDRINLSSRTANDNPDVGIIFLHRIAGVEGTSVSATTFNAPKDAKKSWEKATQIIRALQTKPGSVSKPENAKKLAAAEKELQSAVGVYPKFANAWADLGRVRLLQQDSAGAREAYQKALESDNKLVEPYVALGEQAMRDRDWAGAVQNLDRALQLDPVEYPGLWLQDAVANYNAQNFDKAERSARQSLKIAADKVDPQANELLGLILLNKRDLAGAKDALSAYLKLKPDAQDAAQIRNQLSQIDIELSASR